MKDKTTFMALFSTLSTDDGGTGPRQNKMKFDVLGNPELQDAIISRVNALNAASGNKIPSYAPRAFDPKIGYLFLCREARHLDLGFMWSKDVDRKYFNDSSNGRVATLADLYPSTSPHPSWVDDDDPSSDQSVLNHARELVQDSWDDMSAPLSGSDLSTIIDSLNQLELLVQS